MKKKSKAIILMFTIIISMFILAPAQSTSSSIIITATGNSDTTFVNPSVPPGWPYGTSCTEDVYNIVNAVLDDNIHTIYLQNGVNGEPFVFAGGSPYVWVTKPKIIEGLDDSVPNDGSEVPTDFSATVPVTRIEQGYSIRWVPAFWIGVSGGVTIRNIWFDSNGGVRRGYIFMLPSDPMLGDVTIENNVFVTKKYGLSIWEIDCGLNIVNNYINVQGGVGPNLDESWTALMVWCQNPAYGTEDKVNVVGNYIEFHKAWWAVELGGPTYTSKKTSIHGNTFTGSLTPNYISSYGDASLSLKSGYSKFIVESNLFVDIDAPDGCALLLRGVKDSLIVNNKFKNIQLGEQGDPWTGAIFCTLIPLPGFPDPYTRNCKIVNNDYSGSGLLGWDELDPNAIGCIFMTGYAENNYVVETKFPSGTSIVNQIVDLTDNPATTEYDGDNRIVGLK